MTLREQKGGKESVDEEVAVKGKGSKRMVSLKLTFGKKIEAAETAIYRCEVTSDQSHRTGL